MAKLTDLPTQEEAQPADSSAAGSGEKPPSMRIWQIACHTASVNVKGVREDSGPVDRFYRSE